MVRVLLGVVFLFGFCYSAPKDSCVVQINGKFSFFPPLFFHEDGTLVTSPSNFNEPDHLSINAGENVILSCTPNYFKNYEKDSFVRATCIKDNEFKINNMNVNFDDLSCDLRSIEEIHANVKDCPSQDRGVEFGFTNPLNLNSYVIGESCYSTEEGRTLFVHTMLRNSGTNVSDLALKIADENHFRGTHPSNYYRIEFLKAVNILEQEKTFDKLLGEGHDLQLKVHSYLGNEYLAHQQYEVVKKFAWNSQLVYHHGETSNLDVLRKDILGLGVFNLEIYTGSHDVLTLSNKDNVKVDVYLRVNKFPVPKFIWTVVKSGDKATAFVFMNNPNLTEDEISKASFCESKCNKISWINNLLANDQYRKIENGFILCCDLRDFKTIVTELPDLVDVVGIFK